MASDEEAADIMALISNSQRVASPSWILHPNEAVLALLVNERSEWITRRPTLWALAWRRALITSDARGILWSPLYDALVRAGGWPASDLWPRIQQICHPQPDGSFLASHEVTFAVRARRLETHIAPLASWVKSNPDRATELLMRTTTPECWALAIQSHPAISTTLVEEALAQADALVHAGSRRTARAAILSAARSNPNASIHVRRFVRAVQADYGADATPSMLPEAIGHDVRAMDASAPTAPSSHASTTELVLFGDRDAFTQHRTSETIIADPISDLVADLTIGTLPDLKAALDVVRESPLALEVSREFVHHDHASGLYTGSLFGEAMRSCGARPARPGYSWGRVESDTETPIVDTTLDTPLEDSGSHPEGTRDNDIIPETTRSRFRPKKIGYQWVLPEEDLVIEDTDPMVPPSPAAGAPAIPEEVASIPVDTAEQTPDTGTLQERVEHHAHAADVEPRHPDAVLHGHARHMGHVTARFARWSSEMVASESPIPTPDTLFARSPFTDHALPHPAHSSPLPHNAVDGAEGVHTNDRGQSRQFQVAQPLLAESRVFPPSVGGATKPPQHVPVNKLRWIPRDALLGAARASFGSTDSDAAGALAGCLDPATSLALVSNLTWPTYRDTVRRAWLVAPRDTIIATAEAILTHGFADPTVVDVVREIVHWANSSPPTALIRGDAAVERAVAILSQKTGMAGSQRLLA